MNVLVRYFLLFLLLWTLGVNQSNAETLGIPSHYLLKISHQRPCCRQFSHNNTGKSHCLMRGNHCLGLCRPALPQSVQLKNSLSGIQPPLRLAEARQQRNLPSLIAKDYDVALWLYQQFYPDRTTLYKEKGVFLL